MKHRLRYIFPNQISGRGWKAGELPHGKNDITPSFLYLYLKHRVSAVTHHDTVESGNHLLHKLNSEFAAGADPQETVP